MSKCDDIWPFNDRICHSTICHPLNLMSTNLILSRFLLNLPIFSVLPLSGLCYRPYGLSLTLCTKKKEKEDLPYKPLYLSGIAQSRYYRTISMNRALNLLIIGCFIHSIFVERLVFVFV